VTAKLCSAAIITEMVQRMQTGKVALRKAKFAIAFQIFIIRQFFLVLFLFLRQRLKWEVGASLTKPTLPPQR
jgi:uncharacterized protein with PQ loop repeat